MSDEASLHFRMCLPTERIPDIRTGFLLTLAVIMIIMTDSGMKDGKAIIIL